MKTKATFFIPVLLSGLVIAGCSKESGDSKDAKDAKDAKEPPAAAAAEKTAEPESHVKRGTNGEVVITLDAATQKLMGLQVAPLAPASLPPEIKSYGRVLDASPLASLIGELAAAQAASAASQADLRRLQTLAAQNNASERALQTAEATAARDRAQFESGRLRLVAGWGNAIAARQDLPALVQSLGSLASVLVQIDLPAGESVKAMPTGARVLPLAHDSSPLEAQLVGPAPTVDPQLQGRGFLFLVSTNSAALAPGAAVTGLLALPGEAQSGVLVPREAIIRFQGTTWLYRQTGDETFERMEVMLDVPLENGWFVRETLKPDDKVVTVGAQQLMSEELKGQGTD